MKKKGMTRREFMKSTAVAGVAAAAGTIGFPNVLRVGSQGNPDWAYSSSFWSPWFRRPGTQEGNDAGGKGNQ